MQSVDVKLEPGQDLTELLANQLGIKRGELLGILPVKKYLSLAMGSGIVVAFGGEENGMSFFIDSAMLSDVIKTLQSSLSDGTN
jgi:hypothetical protein